MAVCRGLRSFGIACRDGRVCDGVCEGTVGGCRAITGWTTGCGTRLCSIPSASLPPLPSPPPPSLPWSVTKRKRPGGGVAAAAAVTRVVAALRGVGMDVASARVDEPVPPPDTSGLLDGAVPVGADGEGGGGEAAGGGSEAAGGGAVAGAGPAADVAPVVSKVPAATEGATDTGGSGPAAVPPPEATAAAPLAAEATSPTAGEVGLCTLRCLLANSTEFRMSAPPETTVRDVKTQILTQQPPQVADFLRASHLPAVVSPDEMRLLHLGKFLDDSRKLSEYDFAVGGTSPGDPTDGVTAVHLLCKPHRAAAEEAKERPAKGAGCCCSLM